MKGKESKPQVLVVAVEAARRDALAAALPESVVARRLAPRELAEASRLVDAVASVIHLVDAEDDTLAALEPLLPLQAAQTMVLVPAAITEAALEVAIARLSPTSVIPEPAPAPALRLAVEQRLPSQDAPASAVPGQRSATALLGVSQAINSVIDQVKQVAPSRIPILVLGETGTGKELVARAIHQQSDRASGPFVAVNCSALPDALLESELFGFERGAFTGAQRAKPGLFEQAHGGTFFLDEIGDTSPAMQVKLLRVLETMEIRRLGGNQVRRIDVRIVSATHRDLEASIVDETFRQDLYFRLNTATIFIPPLRRRRVDVPFLAQHFAEQFGEEHARRITLDEEFLRTLERRDFPGNVRELRNAVERAIALAEPGEVLSARHLERIEGDGHSYAAAPAVGTLKARVEQLETDMIREALERFEGNRTRAAEALGLSRLGLRQKMKRLNLEAPADS